MSPEPDLKCTPNFSFLDQDLGRLNVLKAPPRLGQEITVESRHFHIRLKGRSQYIEVQTYKPVKESLPGLSFFGIPGAAHGANSHELFARQLAHRGHEVHVMSPPGTGTSPTPENFAGLTGLSFGNLVRVAWDTFTALDLKRAVWFGHSMGGGKLLKIAAQNPEAIAGAILHSSISDRGTWYANATCISTVPGKYIEANLKRDLAPFFSSLEVGKKLLFSKARTEAEIKPFVDKLGTFPFRAYAETLIPGFIQPEVLAKNNIPTLVLAGYEDRIFPLSHAKSLEKLTKGELRIFEKSSHNILMDHQALEAVAEVSEWYHRNGFGDVRRAE